MGGGISKMAKQELLATIRDRYRASSKREKSRILDEFIAVTGHHRKHGIRFASMASGCLGNLSTMKAQLIPCEAGASTMRPLEKR